MKKRLFRLSAVGVAIVLAVVVFVEQNHGVNADSSSLSTEQFASWAWSGTPVNQRFNVEGNADEAAIGFIHLNCDSLGGDCSAPDGEGKVYPDVQMHLDPEEADFGNVSGWAWLGTSSDETDGAIGWLNFDPEPAYDTYPLDSEGNPCGYPTEPCVDAQIDTENREEIYGWARIETLACYGHEQINGGSYCGTTNDYHDNDWGWVQLRGTVNNADADEFGLTYRDGHIEGWAWSGGGTIPGRGFANTLGFGWLQFFPGVVVVSDSGYFSTEGANVYAQQGIANPDDVTTSDDNATFLLLGSGTQPVDPEDPVEPAQFVNFTTELGEDGTLGDYNELTVPDAGSGYQNQLGEIDFEKLETFDETTKLNVYGDEVDNELGSLNNLDEEHKLDGKVYVLGDPATPNQTFRLDEAVTFSNATSSPSTGQDYNGSGVIIVYGDLELNANTFYETSQITDVQNLSSIAWIVHGDVIVGENVTNTVGAFFILQDDGNGGRFETLPSESQQLKVQGLVMAYQFELQRTYQGTLGLSEPAELFQYDGRILINTPPGLRDYTATLPRFGQ